MKTPNDTIEEQALSMYKETVSPQRDQLRAILSHIPEVRKTQSLTAAVRSPYTWVVFAQAVMLCSILLAVFPTIHKIYSDPFYQIDNQVNAFESGIQQEDSQEDLVN